MYQRISRQEAAISLWNLQDIMLQKNGDFPMFDAVVPTSGAPMLVDGLAKIADGPGGAGADAFISYLMSTEVQDRKSTRLNSSHVAISYAVFCLKKKKTK